MALKDKLHNVKMNQGEGVSSYLTCMVQVKDELTAVGETISDSEMVRISLKGFTKRWDVFVKCIVGRETLPNWSRLWDDFTHEEIREGALGGQVSEEMEQNVALAAKSKNKNKKDLSQIKCYHCGQLGHYATKCPEKKIVKTERDVAASAVVEEFSTKFEQEFSLVSIDSSIGSSTFEHVWVVDSGATKHMNRIYDSFQIITKLEQ